MKNPLFKRLPYILKDEIAKYKIEATKTHLNCVYKTQKVLSKKQLEILKNL